MLNGKLDVNLVTGTDDTRSTDNSPVAFSVDAFQKSLDDLEKQLLSDERISARDIDDRNVMLLLIQVGTFGPDRLVTFQLIVFHVAMSQ